ncbi:amino acid ABC transporter ATP-binding protein [Galactobacter caseinivorans]|uniref:ABC-type polar-amino-acid transporter n=1 Tax=Galactobacter caseinivorans TaxID=2676123 RepID=A0A496PMR5_9MICC|nr:amino acid ABC transporter ATP-binding protein [Galactobacter caseinivorans]RKW71832.1 amino acid ABC transporter ATP-binding protein [Galactobacter caseinivorans]
MSTITLNKSTPAASDAATPAAKPHQAAEPLAKRGAAVSLRGVSKSYGATPVLRGIHLDVAPGEVVTLIGPSGSGKSTLLRTINHLETVDAGSVTVGGEHLGYTRRGDKLVELPEREVLRRRTRVGLVFQHFNLFPHLTALQNITMAPTALGLLSKDQAATRATALLERVGLAEHTHHFPRQLSGGQQQRVAIARALALEPEVLLFDEPTSALDPELVGEVLDVIRQVANLGTTLIIVTHEIGFAREVSDRIIFLDQGHVVETGTPDQLLNHPEHERTRDFISRVL